MVDDFMMMIPYVLRAPPAPSPTGNGKNSRTGSFDSTMFASALRSVFPGGSRSGSERSARSRHSFSIRSFGSAKSKNSAERSYTEAQILAASVGSPRQQPPRLERIESMMMSTDASTKLNTVTTTEQLRQSHSTAEVESAK